MKYVGVREFKQDAVKYLNEGNEIVMQLSQLFSGSALWRRNIQGFEGQMQHTCCRLSRAYSNSLLTGIQFSQVLELIPIALNHWDFVPSSSGFSQTWSATRRSELRHDKLPKCIQRNGRSRSDHRQSQGLRAKKICHSLRADPFPLSSCSYNPVMSTTGVLYFSRHDSPRIRKNSPSNSNTTSP